MLAKVAIFAASVAGIWVTVPDVYAKIFVNLVSLGAAFAGVRYISKFSVPQTSAISYFRSFVKPVGEALKSGSWKIEYKDPVSGSPTPVTLDPKAVDARLEIVLPKDLSLGTTLSGAGLHERQAALKPKTEGDLHVASRTRGFTVHFDLTNGASGRQLVILDVPNTLNPLREIQYDDEPDASRREKRGNRALKEFSEELRKNLVRFRTDMEKVTVF